MLFEKKILNNLFLGWDEIYDFKNVRKGLKKQAARCMDCGVPFCHSTSHGCPLGNSNQLFVYIFKKKSL